MTPHDKDRGRRPHAGGAPQPDAPGGDPAAEAFLRDLEGLKEPDGPQSLARPTPASVSEVKAPGEGLTPRGKPEHPPAGGKWQRPIWRTDMGKKELVELMKRSAILSPKGEAWLEATQACEWGDLLGAMYLLDKDTVRRLATALVANSSFMEEEPPEED